MQRCYWLSLIFNRQHGKHRSIACVRSDISFYKADKRFLQLFFDNLFVYNKFTGLDITVKIIIKYTNITQIVVCDIGIFTIRYTGDLFFDRRSQFPVGKNLSL